MPTASPARIGRGVGQLPDLLRRTTCLHAPRGRTERLPISVARTRAHAARCRKIPPPPRCGDRGGPDRGPGGDGEVASCTRSLLPLGRFDEAERLLEEARAVPPPGSGVRVLAAAAEALLLAREFEQAEALARTAVATAETRTDNVWWQARTSPPCSSAQDGSTRRVKHSSDRSGSGEERAARPAPNASASRSSRSPRAGGASATNTFACYTQ